MAGVEMSYNKEVLGSDINSNSMISVKNEAVKTSEELASRNLNDVKLETTRSTGQTMTDTVPFASKITLQNISLHVGDLTPETKEVDLLEFFGRELIKSVRICLDTQSNRSLCTGYVNFNEHEDAKKALEDKNYRALKGRPIRIAWAQKNRAFSQLANLFIKNVDKGVDARTLYEAFATFGTITSFKMATDETGHSKGYGFVQYENKDISDVVIDKLNDLEYRGKKLCVKYFIPKSERPQPSSATEYTNLYFKNFLEIMTEDEMLKELSKYGNIISNYFSDAAKNQTTGFGFACFDTHENAIYAEKQISSTVYNDGKKIYIVRALSKRERVRQVEDSLRQRRLARHTSNKNMNLYIKNIDPSVTSQSLNDLFAPFGTISSSKVMTDNNNMSLCFGFVCFVLPECAEKALEYFRKPNPEGNGLYVNFAQLKEDRERVIREKLAKTTLTEGIPQSSMTIGNAINAGYPAHYIQIPQNDSKYHNQYSQMGFNQYSDKPRSMPSGNLQPHFYNNVSSMGIDGRSLHPQYENRRNPQQNIQMYNKMGQQQNHDMTGLYPSNIRYNQGNRQNGQQMIRKHQVPYNSAQRGPQNNMNHQYYQRQPNSYEAYDSPKSVASADIQKSAPSQIVSDAQMNELFRKLEKIYGSTQTKTSIGYMVSTITSQVGLNIDEFINDESKLEEAGSSILKSMASNKPTSS